MFIGKNTMINYEALEEEFENLPEREKITKYPNPINTHHSMLVGVEAKMNRIRKQRKEKYQLQENF